jgi:hypothetical protein
MFRSVVAVVAALALTLAFALAVRAGSSPEQLCQKARYFAAAKYSACQQKALGKLFAGDGPIDVIEGPLSNCRVKYTGTWAKLQAVASGTGDTCDSPRYEDNGDGTVFDNLTGLQWEQTTDDGTVHDKDNVYTWSAGSFNADGTAFTGHLATLNSGSCFAGECDWRLPTRAELQTILSEPFRCTTHPCIDQGVFGPTAGHDYWASTADDRAGLAWFVFFGDGYVGLDGEADTVYVRAVRGGL